MKNLKYLFLTAGMLFCFAFSILSADVTAAVSNIKAPFSLVQQAAEAAALKDRPMLDTSSLEYDVLLNFFIDNFYRTQFQEVGKTLKPELRDSSSYSEVLAKFNVNSSRSDFRYAFVLSQSDVFAEGVTFTEDNFIGERDDRGVTEAGVKEFRNELEQLYLLLQEFLKEVKL